MTDETTLALARLIAAMRPEGHPTGGKGTVLWGEPGHVPLCGCRYHGEVAIVDDRCRRPLTRGA